jgi:hypothetical protein
MTAPRVRLARAALVVVALNLSVFGATRVHVERSDASPTNSSFAQATAVAATPAVITERPSPSNHATLALAWAATVLLMAAACAWAVASREGHRLLPSAVWFTWRRRGPPASMFS